MTIVARARWILNRARDGENVSAQVIRWALIQTGDWTDIVEARLAQEEE